MERFYIDEVIKTVNGNCLQKGLADSISSVKIDSRRIAKGDMYIPIIGERLDGHRFINDAVNNGAAVVLTMRNSIDVPEGVYLIHVEDTVKALQALGRANRLRYDIPVTAVTGSSGKTTTKDVIASVLSQHFQTMKTQGNFNNYLGVPQTMLQLDAGYEAAVVETGMGRMGEIAETIDEILPHYVVITNIGTAHLEYLKTRENILKAKMEALSTLTTGDIAILNGDDPYLNQIHEQEYSIIRIGIRSENDHLDYKAEDVISDSNGVCFTLNGESYHFGLSGEHNVRNCMAAIVIAKDLGLTREEIQAGFDAFVPSGNRMKIETLNGVTYIDDSYNANPDAMRAAMNVLSDMGEKAGRRIAILGDMLELGDDAEKWHREIGEYAALHSDILIAVGELAKLYIEGAAEKMSEKALHYCRNVDEAKKWLADHAQRDDMVLIKASNGVGLKKIMQQMKGASEK